MFYSQETWWKWLPHDMIIFTKFHENQTKNVDLLILVNFERVSFFFIQTLLFSMACVKEWTTLYLWLTIDLCLFSGWSYHPSLKRLGIWRHEWNLPKIESCDKWCPHSRVHLEEEPIGPTGLPCSTWRAHYRGKIWQNVSIID